MYFREEVQKYEQIVEDLRGQVRLHDAIPTHEDGLADMYMSEAQRGVQNVTIDRLTRYMKAALIQESYILNHVCTIL